MSRNSKNARNIQRAKQFALLRKGGGRGPASTTPAHSKRRENCQWYKYHNNIAIKRAQQEDDVASQATLTLPQSQVKK